MSSAGEDERVFVIYDVEHDRDLYKRLVSGSGIAGLGLAISGGSASFAWTEPWRERARSGIRGADRVLVVCGEHTEESVGVASEFRIVQEEGKPYLLLWGRRERMCTKPSGARPGDGMYVWTPQTLEEQFTMMRRIEQRQATARAMKRTPVLAQTSDQQPGS